LNEHLFWPHTRENQYVNVGYAAGFTASFMLPRR